MKVHKLDIFHSDGRMRMYELWSIYALFCEPKRDEALVKIGISSIIYDRALAVQVGMAYPIGVILHARVGERGVTQSLEAKLHRAFRHRNTRGEWFRFNIDEQSEKTEFHCTFKKLYREQTGCDLSWSKIYPEQLRAYSALQARDKHERARA